MPMASPPIAMDASVDVPSTFVLSEALNSSLYAPNSCTPLSLNVHGSGALVNGSKGGATAAEGEFVVQVFKGNASFEFGKSPSAAHLPREMFLWRVPQEEGGPAPAPNGASVGTETASVRCGDQNWLLQHGAAAYANVAATAGSIPSGAISVEQPTDSIVLCVYNRSYFPNPAASTGPESSAATVTN